MTKIGNDWLGYWFHLTEQTGQDIRIRFGWQSADADHTEPDWQFLPHAEVDGIGGLALLLRKRLAPQHVSMPTIHPDGRAGRFAQFLATLRQLGQKPIMSAKWAPLPDAPATSTPTTFGLPTAVAWTAFTASETSALRERARAAGISLNSLLLWTLGQAISPSLIPHSGPLLWTIPVNVRGAVELPRDTDNHTSFMAIDTPLQESVEALHQRVMTSLRRSEHWGMWHLFNVGRWSGKFGMRQLWAITQRRGEWRVGVFSNLGAWPVAHDDLSGQDGLCYFAPPVWQYAPFGAGAVTWHGRLTLTLQMHPTVSADPQSVKTVLDRWRQTLLAWLAT